MRLCFATAPTLCLLLLTERLSGTSEYPMPPMPRPLMPIMATVFVMLFLWISAVPLLSWYEFSADYQDLADESFQWHHQGISNYNFEFEILDFKSRSVPGPIRIHVRDSKFVAAYRIDSDELVDIMDLADVPATIESAFELAKRLLEAQPYRIDIEYDAVLHYPASVSVSFSDRSRDRATYNITWFETVYDSP